MVGTMQALYNRKVQVETFIGACKNCEFISQKDVLIPVLTQNLRIPTLLYLRSFNYFHTLILVQLAVNQFVVCEFVTKCKKGPFGAGRHGTRLAL